jgi:hypothetical protein
LVSILKFPKSKVRFWNQRWKSRKNSITVELKNRQLGWSNRERNGHHFPQYTERSLIYSSHWAYHFQFRRSGHRRRTWRRWNEIRASGGHPLVTNTDGTTAKRQETSQKGGDVQRMTTAPPCENGDMERDLAKNPHF